MPTQENDSARSGQDGVPAAYAVDALRQVETSQVRARLRSEMTPAWYGPVAAVTLVVPTLVRAWSEGRRGWPVLASLIVSLAELGIVFAFARAARRGSGVLGPLPRTSRMRRVRVVLPTVVAVGVLAGAVCWAAGAGETTIDITVFAVWALGVWGACLARNEAIRRTLAELG